jgi:hypothetical protein
MEKIYCQCCGMPMGTTDELYGTEKDGSTSTDYCKYCYEDGVFLFNGSMEEMIEICVPPMVEANPDMTQDDARKMMTTFLPMLKRWRAK